MPGPGSAVVLRHEGQADGHRLMGPPQVVDEQQVAERLRHLGALVVHQRLMQPVPDERLARHRLGLGPLALVVGVEQVRSPAVQVDGLAQLPQRQRRALDMPAGPPRPPAGLPRRLAGSGLLPQHEVEPVPLGRVVGVVAPLAAQLDHVVAPESRQRAEAAEGLRVEVHAPAGAVREAPLDGGVDEAPDVGDGRRRPGLRGRRQGVQRGHVVVEAGRLVEGQVEIVDPPPGGCGQDVVVDVGDVAHAAGLAAHVPQPPLQHVVGDVGGGVPQVGGVVGRDAAHVHAHHLRRVEIHHRAAGGVVEPQGHAAPAGGRTAATASPRAGGQTGAATSPRAAS